MTAPNLLSRTHLNDGTIRLSLVVRQLSRILLADLETSSNICMVGPASDFATDDIDHLVSSPAIDATRSRITLGIRDVSLP